MKYIKKFLQGRSLRYVSIGYLWNQFLHEETSFKLLCLYFIIEYIRPQSIYPIIDIIPYGKLFLCLSFLFGIRGKKIGVKSNLDNILIGGFTAVVVISSATGLSIDLSLQTINIYFMWLFCYFLIVRIVNSETRLLIVILIIIVCSLKMSQHSAFQWARVGFAYTHDGIGGGKGWFENTGEFGVQMCIAFALCISLLKLEKGWPLNAIIYFAIVTFFIGVIACASRGVQLGFIAGILYIILYSRKKTLFILISIILFCIALYIIPKEQIDRMIASGSDKTSVTRIERWEKGIKMALTYPFFGVGYGNWQYADKILFNGDGGECHNIFIQCASELGFSGLVLFIFLIISCFRNNYKTRLISLQNNMIFEYYAAVSFDVSLVAFLVCGLFVTILYYPFFWINYSLTVCLRNFACHNLKIASINSIYKR